MRRRSYISYKTLVDERLSDESIYFFDVISKTQRNRRKTGANKLDTMKENVIVFSEFFINYIQYVKSVLIWSYSGPHFPAFGLNTER